MYLQNEIHGYIYIYIYIERERDRCRCLLTYMRACSLDEIRFWFASCTLGSSLHLGTEHFTALPLTAKASAGIFQGIERVFMGSSLN